MLSIFSFLKKSNPAEIAFGGILHEMLGFKPRNIKLYKPAFIHKSASELLPDGSLVNNERLEYLGDALLDAIIADYLFVCYPDRPEGFLSQMRSKIVKRQHLNGLAHKIGIDRVLRSNTDSCNPTKHIYGDALEALIGAVYLDQGYEVTQRFIVDTMLKRHVNLKALEATETDYKSRLIEWAQKHKKEISFQSRVEYEEPEKNPSFVATVVIDPVVTGFGKGNSKKEAEQHAAEHAYLEIGRLHEYQQN